HPMVCRAASEYPRTHHYRESFRTELHRPDPEDRPHLSQQGPRWCADPNDRPHLLHHGPRWRGMVHGMGGNKIGRVTTAGNITAEYPILTPNSVPSGIAAGPDGALWFTEESGAKIGRIPSAGAITEYPIPRPDSDPGAIAVGADGALWFTEQHA